ncbi:MAG: hypothetical protein GY728_05575, partial [Phycisphaeraceae bacterium]|nr:hypothetical protein [Phycisphaeraceae bacterium]
MTPPHPRRHLISAAALVFTGLLAFASAGQERPPATSPPTGDAGVAGPPAPTTAEPVPLPSPRVLIT